MSGSGMIPAIPEGMPLEIDRDDGVGVMLRRQRDNIALGIICLAAAKCTEVQSLADCGRIDRDGADLFIRRYSESISDIVGLIAPRAPKKGN